MSPRGSDTDCVTVRLSVTEIAGLCLHKISYIKKFSVDLTHCSIILKIICTASFRSLDVVLCDHSIII